MREESDLLLTNATFLKIDCFEVKRFETKGRVKRLLSPKGVAAPSERLSVRPRGPTRPAPLLPTGRGPVLRVPW